MTTTVLQAEAVQTARAALIELDETEERLRARHHALSLILSRRFNNLVTVPPEVGDLSVADAAREMDEIDRQLAALARRRDAQQAALITADVAAQASILESAMPEYRELVAACDRAKAKWDEAEGAREAFLLDLRRRGVFQTPVIAERERQ
jgi:siderophore synthetase component